MDPGFISGDDWTQISCRFRLKRSKHYFEVDSRIRLLSTVSNRGIHRADSFLILNFSYKMLIAVPYDTPTASATLCTFVRRSWRIMSWTVFNDFRSNQVCQTAWALLIKNRCTATFKFVEPISHSWLRLWKVPIDSI